MMSAPEGLRRIATRHVDDWEESRRSTGGLLVVMLRMLTTEFHRRLDAAGHDDLRPGSGNVFEHIGSKGSSVASMAQRAGISAQAMVQVVDYLESKSYVSRGVDPADRRIKVVRLTERGIAANRAARQSLEDIEAEWSRSLGEDRYRAFKVTLRDLVAMIETPS